jgi:YVTN family beta-propeller protein
MKLSKDGKRLYVALNLSNRAAEIDAETGAVLRTWNVGVQPYDIALVGDKLYVWGGRRPMETASLGRPDAAPWCASMGFATLRARARSASLT